MNKKPLPLYLVLVDNGRGFVRVGPAHRTKKSAESWADFSASGFLKRPARKKDYKIVEEYVRFKKDGTPTLESIRRLKRHYDIIVSMKGTKSDE